MSAESFSWLQLLLVPVTGLLWSISGKLGHLTAGHEAHAAKLADHAARITHLEKLA